MSKHWSELKEGETNWRPPKEKSSWPKLWVIALFVVLGVGAVAQFPPQPGVWIEQDLASLWIAITVVTYGTAGAIYLLKRK